MNNGNVIWRNQQSVEYEQAIKVEPQDSEGYHNSGVTLVKLGLIASKTILPKRPIYLSNMILSCLRWKTTSALLQRESGGNLLVLT